MSPRYGASGREVISVPSWRGTPAGSALSPELFANGIALLEPENQPCVLMSAGDPLLVEQAVVFDVETVQHSVVATRITQMLFVASADQSHNLKRSRRQPAVTAERRRVRVAWHPRQRTAEFASSRGWGHVLTIYSFGKRLFLSQVGFDLLGIRVIVREGGVNLG